MAADVSLVVRVLGPVVLAGPDGPISLDRPLERGLAVRLALAGGTPVPDGVLIQALWGDAELNRPAERLRVVVSRLRTSLGGAAGALRRVPGAYALAARVPDVAAAESAAAVVRAASSRGDAAAVCAAAADLLALWRGPALADLRAVPFAAVEAARLDELRLQVQVERITAETDLGRGSEVRGELDQLVRDHPLHERLCRLLAVALYRDGRPAAALDLLAQLRRRLADELGADPAPDTAALEIRILQHDASLAPPATTGGLPNPRLPAPSTGILGRDAETAALLEQLRSPRLITLIGPPGSGKTRLALEVARVSLASRRPVAWVDLASLGDPEAVLPAVLTACGIENAPHDPVESLAAAFDSPLLVIDNAEHLVEPVARLLGALWREGSGASVLVTSQRPLMIAGEEVRQVGPLPPGSAAALFCARSALARDARVEAICAAVDYLPLGIELAAGLTRTLTLDQVAQRLDDRLRLLVGGARDGGIRHTSMRAALDWSFALLDAAGRAVLRRVAVFAGGWTLEAAERVVAGDGIDAGDVAPILTDLVDRSLVTMVRDDPGAPRFRLLQSVRDYAAEKLQSAGEADAVRHRHLAWCRAHVAAHDVQGPDEAGALRAIYSEWPDLLSALEGAPGTDRAREGLRLAIALDDAWMFRGLHEQARRHYRALVGAPGASAEERALGLSNYGFVCAVMGETDLAAELLERASNEARSAGRPELQMRVLFHRGVALVEGGRPVDAMDPLHAAEAVAQQLGRDRSLAAIRDVRATAMLYAGDAVGAKALHAESNEMDRAAGHLHGLVRGLVNEAASRYGAGDQDGALACADEGTGIAQQLEDAVAEATLRQVRGQVAVARGDIVEAIRHFEAALGKLEADEIDAKLCRLDLADALLRTGATEAAHREVDRVLAASRDRGVAWLLAQPTLALLALADGDVSGARRTLRVAADEYAARGFAWPLAVERMTRAEQRLAAAEQRP